MFRNVCAHVVIGIVVFLGGITNVSASTATSSAATIHDRSAVEMAVTTAFSDSPVMIAIALCESNFRQYTDDGSVFRGGAGGEMVGVFQFYEKVHSASAAKLGFSIETLEGNIAYAEHVYKESGTSPWASCVPVSPMPADDVTALKITLLKQVVSLLTQLLALKMSGS